MSSWWRSSWVSSWRSSWVSSILMLMVVPIARAETDTHPIQAALDNGRLAEAEKLVEQIPDQQDPLVRDQWLGKLALAQLQSGNPDAAKSALRRIGDRSQLTKAATSVAQHARGGATGADFQSLIDLITTTVEPNSWDEVGGPGTVIEFPGGVKVNAQGVISTAAPGPMPRSLEVVRDAAKQGVAHGDVNRATELRMVSLPRLERELLLRLAMGEAPTDAMTHLAGLFEIRYVFVFPETDDVVIAGPAAGWQEDAEGRAVTAQGRPVLLLDDLVCLIRNARRQGNFGCSIDPKQENLAATQAFLARPTGTLKPSQTRRWVDQIRNTLGLQNIRVYGIEPTSHAARVIVEADYHMKLMGMGLEPSVDGLDSYLDSIDTQSIPKSMDVLRWWFTLDRDGLVRNEKGTAFDFSSQVVRLQSENEQLARDGTRSRSGTASALNQQFAHQFTRQFSRLCHQYPIYAQLDQVFRMALVAGILQSAEVKSAMAWDADWFGEILQPARGAAPEEVASIVNHRVIGRRDVVVGVSGGVTVNAADCVRHLEISPGTAVLDSARQSARRTLVRDSHDWWWD